MSTASSSSKTRTSTKNVVNVPGNIIGKRAALELSEDDIVNIGVGIPETVTKYARESGILDKVTLTVESGGVGGFPASGKVFGAVIGADSMYDMANQFDLYNNGGLDICFMGGIEVDKYGNVNDFGKATLGSGVFIWIMFLFFFIPIKHFYRHCFLHASLFVQHQGLL